MAASSSALPPVLDLLGVIRRWRRPILLTTLGAALVSAVVALRMPNIYPATTTFYATNLETADPDQLSSGERKVVLLPEAIDLDRAVNIGSSQPVADYIIKKYRLAAHYNYDTTATPEARQSVRELFRERIEMHINDRDAVELTVLDTDRDLAATIANEMVVVIDSVNQQLLRPNRLRVLKLFENKYRQLDAVYAQTRDSLTTLRRRTGIHGLDREDRYLAKAITETQTALRAARNGGGGNATALQATLDGLLYTRPGSNTLTLESFATHGPNVSRLQGELSIILNDLVKARSAYEVARANLGSRISTVYVLQPATPTPRKAKPVRWLIVVGSAAGAFVLMTLAALLLEWLRRPTAPATSSPEWAAEPTRVRA